MKEMETYFCPKVSIAPKIDGILGDEAWATAPEVRLVLAETGQSPVNDTTARMCWDDECLYVAFECRDNDIQATFTKHDDPVFLEDAVEVFLDPDSDLETYFEIDVSPANVVFDALFDPNSGLALGDDRPKEWTCKGLRTAVTVDGAINDHTVVDVGWTAEIAIPFASLGRSVPQSGESWRANLYRVDRSNSSMEYQAWSPTLVTPVSFHVPGCFKTVVFTDLMVP